MSRPRVTNEQFAKNSHVVCANTFIDGEGQPMIQLWVARTLKATDHPTAYLSKHELQLMIEKLDELSGVTS